LTLLLQSAGIQEHHKNQVSTINRAVGRWEPPEAAAY